MATLTFEQLAFRDETDQVAFSFLNLYRGVLAKKDLLAIGKCTVSSHALSFDASEKSCQTKFNRLLAHAFDSLIGPNNRPVTYIHPHSGIPLIGTNDFGIVDRDTDVIEVKPMTGCNLNCTFCSVDEGNASKKVRDFLVEKDLLVSAFADLADKKHKKLEAHIAGQNEPTLYPELVGLITDLSRIPQVKEVSIDTNGILLSETRIAELSKAGLSRIDLSIHALDPDLARRLAGGPYAVESIIRSARSIAKSPIKLLIAPVFLHGVNDGEIEKLILLSKELHCLIGIQNFYAYDHGRRLVREMPMEDFDALLVRWEKRYAVDLHLKGVFSISKDKVLEKPFQKGDKVRVRVFSPGKYPGEVLACAQGRVVTVFFARGSLPKKEDTLMVKIVRDKHNIFTAVPSH
jgi:uncharacterized protein